MSKIELNKAQKESFLLKLQNYFDNELDIELGQFDAEFLLDFIAKEMGNVFYNQGLYDSQAALENQIESVQEAILQLEK